MPRTIYIRRKADVRRKRRPNVALRFPPGGKVVAVGQVTETDLAQAVTWAPKARLVNQVTETELAQAITRRKIRAVAQAVETDLAQAIARITKLRGVS